MIRTVLFTFVFAIISVMVSPSTAQTFSENDIRIVQRALTNSGYKAGGVDGRFGGKTASAIRVYQSDWMLVETGKISTELIARLTREHPATRARNQKSQNNPDCEAENKFPQAREILIIEGNCIDGLLNGDGKIIWRLIKQGQWNETRTSGQFRNGKVNGRGISIWPSGNRYEGEYRDGKRNGRGIFTWAGGNRYEGEYRDGKKHGSGIFTWPDGGRYEGEYRDGKQNGQGTELWSNGNRYEGEYLGGKKHGQWHFHLGRW